MDKIPSFKNYNFIFKKAGNRLQQIKKNIGWTNQSIQEYITDNPEYTIMKPRDTGNYLQWLQYMYYNPSFATTYTQLSRRMIMLRLSFFSSGKCIMSLDNENLMTLNDFQKKEIPRLNNMENYNPILLKLLLLNADPNIEAYFELLNDAQLIKTGSKPLPTAVFTIPESYSFLALENNLSTVIQYSFSYKNFLRDKRRHLGELSLQRDKEKITTLIGDIVSTPSVILTLYKLLRSQVKKTHCWY